MPVVTGSVRDRSVSVLRDTGCSGVVIKRDLVADEELTGRFGYMLLIDKTIRKVPIAKVFIDTPYFTGEVEAQCLPDAMYDVIIGNIPNSRSPEDPNPSWETVCAVTRAQAKKGQGLSLLKIPDVAKCATVTREQLIKFQHDDSSLERLRKFTEPKITRLSSIVMTFKLLLLFIGLCVISCHQATAENEVVYLNKTKFVNDRIMRWAMFMQCYKFKVESIKGSENVGADFLSRVI